MNGDNLRKIKDVEKEGLLGRVFGVSGPGKCYSKYLCKTATVLEFD